MDKQLQQSFVDSFHLVHVVIFQCFVRMQLPVFLVIQHPVDCGRAAQDE